MANLTGNLSQVGSAVLTLAAATKFQEMSNAYTLANPGKNLIAAQGYVSVWDWAQEAADLWTTHHDPSIQSKFTTIIRPLLEKADATQEDFNTLLTFFKDQVGSGRDPQGKPCYNFGNNKVPALAQSGWAAYRQAQLSWAHPYFAENQVIFGVPNRIDLDPRRTGNLVVIDMDASGGGPTIDWLFMNSHNYGFYWQGPTNELWAFIDPATSKITKTRADMLTKFSFHANGYPLYKNEGKPEPTSRTEIESWGKTKGAAGEWLMSGLTYVGNTTTPVA